MSESGHRQAVRRLLASATLVCGTEMDTLLEQVADGYAGTRSHHQRECVYCQAALEQLTIMWAPIAAMATEPVPVPPDLTAAMTRFLHSTAHDVWCLSVTELGAVRIAGRAVTAVACDAARRVSGVRAAFGRSARAAPTAPQPVSRRRTARGPVGEPDAVAVELAVTVTEDESAGDVAREVRHRVAAVLRDRLGLHVTAVGVAVDRVGDG